MQICNPLIWKVMGYIPYNQLHSNSFGHWWAILYIYKLTQVTHLKYIKPKFKGGKEGKKLRVVSRLYIWVWQNKINPFDCCFSYFYLYNPCLQIGQHDIIFSHWSTHFRWNIWEHGNCLTSSSSLYLAKQIQHSCKYITT